MMSMSLFVRIDSDTQYWYRYCAYSSSHTYKCHDFDDAYSIIIDRLIRLSVSNVNIVLSKVK